MFAWFKRLFSNPRTTIAGITALATASATVAGMVKGTVAVTPETISATGGAIATGVGLILAGDGTAPTTEGE